MRIPEQGECFDGIILENLLYTRPEISIQQEDEISTSDSETFPYSFLKGEICSNIIIIYDSMIEKWTPLSLDTLFVLM